MARQTDHERCPTTEIVLFLCDCDQCNALDLFAEDDV